MPASFLNGLEVNNQRIQNVASPSGANDAVNKNYVDQLLQGLTWKQPVRAATTTNGALSTAYANGQTVDGYTLVTGDRILVKDQTTGTENGIYVVNSSGAPTRATDADATAELQNATTYVITGSVNADRAFTQTANDPTIGTTALVWAQVGGSGGTNYTPGTGISISGSTIAIDTAVTARKQWQNSVATSAGTAQAYSHTLNTVDVDIVIIEVSTGARKFMDGTATNATTVTLTSGTAVAAGQYRIGIFA